MSDNRSDFDPEGGDPQPSDTKKKRKRRYTCKEYRAEMRLLSLMRQLENPALSAEKRKTLEDEIQQIERELEMK